MDNKIKIKVQGHLDKRWKDWFEGMDISYEGDTTILCGSIKDNSCMYGTLNKLRDLNLKLISLNPIE